MLRQLLTWNAAGQFILEMIIDHIFTRILFALWDRSKLMTLGLFFFFFIQFARLGKTRLFINTFLFIIHTLVTKIPTPQITYIYFNHLAIEQTDSISIGVMLLMNFIVFSTLLYAFSYDILAVGICDIILLHIAIDLLLNFYDPKFKYIFSGIGICLILIIVAANQNITGYLGGSNTNNYHHGSRQYSVSYQLQIGQPQYVQPQYGQPQYNDVYNDDNNYYYYED